MKRCRHWVEVDSKMIDWQQIETVLLDMDGTLLDLHFDNFFWLEHLPRRYAQTHQLDLELAHQELMEKFRQQEGSLNWYCLDYWSEVLALDIPSLKREIQHKVSLRPQVKLFLQRLRNAKIRTLIVTNAHPASIELKMNCTDIGTQVDAIICSHDFNKPKEDPAFWREFAQQQAINKNRSLLIDDSLAVLRSARQFGIKYLLTISKPDSQQPQRKECEFQSIKGFADVMAQDFSR